MMKDSPIMITGADISRSIAAALQFISYTHPADFIRHLRQAWEHEQSPAAKQAMTQILVNSRMALLGHRPICQDTGIVNVFLKIGMNVHIASDQSVQALVDDGVRAAYGDDRNPLRASVVSDPLFGRRNTGDNTPAVVQMEVVPGNSIDVIVAAKGGGSENKTKFAVLLPSDSVADWVVDAVSTMGAGWCPPGMLGIGIGGTVEKAMALAKDALMQPLDMMELLRRGPETPVEKLRVDIYDRVNALGIGAQGLGGLTTVLDVKIASWPTHAASMPVAVIPNCAATRHVHFTLSGHGVAEFEAPDLNDWPDIVLERSEAGITRVNLDQLTRDDVRSWRAGQTLLLSGTMLTARDAAHKRLRDMVAAGQPLPFSFQDRVVYYVGPVDPIAGEVVGPAGPTTATRMDPFSDFMFGEIGVLAAIGKAERGADTVAAIARHGAASLIAVGGAAYLIAKAVKSARVVAFPDLGMEAIHAFVVEDMPVTVAVDASGRSVHVDGPLAWRRITA